MEGVAKSRIIRLPDEAETGGYKGIWKKSLHLFHFLAHSKLGNQYDFVFKGDDDTFVNVPQMLEYLKAFDPEIPLKLGNNLYGVSCRGVAPDSPFFWENKGGAPCHGGAGYAMSRGLLKIVGPHVLGCSAEFPSTSYEDAKVEFCMMRHAANKCIGMKKEFGWDRYHNAKRDKVAMKLDNLEKIPVILGTASTFHPVPPAFQQRIYDTISRIRFNQTADLTEATAKTLASSVRKLVSTWNCTIRFGGKTDAIGHDAPKDANALCMQYPLLNPPLANTPREKSSKVKKYRLPWVAAKLPPQRGGSADAVVVVCPPEIEHRAQALAILVRSLRSTKSTAAVVIFGVAGLLTSAKQALEGISNVSFNEIDEIAAQANGEGFHGFGTVALVLSEYLRSQRTFLRTVLLTAPESVFQNDPFAVMQVRGGILASVTKTFSRALRATEPDGGVVFTVMGTCNKREEQLRDNAIAGGERKGPGWYYFRGPGLVDVGTVIGTAAAVEVALAEALHDFGEVGAGFRKGCTVEQQFSRTVWNYGIAERVPVTIPAVGQSPVVNLGARDGSLWSVRHGMVLNQLGRVASVLRYPPGHCLCCSGKGVAAPPPTDSGSPVPEWAARVENYDPNYIGEIGQPRPLPCPAAVVQLLSRLREP
jgi:hypothetical protein